MTKNKQKKIFSLQLQFSLIFFLLSLTIGSVILVIHHQLTKNILINNIKIRLCDIANITAGQINTDLHSKIKTAEDEKKKEYLEIKKNLLQIKNSSTNIRYIYTMIHEGASTIKIIVDAETDPLDIAHAGTEYNDASPFLKKNFINISRPVAENNYYTDRWGTWLSGYAPFYTPDGKHAGLVGVDISAHKIKEYEKDQYFIILLVFLFLLPFSMVFGALLGKKIASPVKELIKSADIVSAGDLDHRIELKSKSEIGLLAISFSRMTIKLKNQIEKLSNEISEREAAEASLLESEEKFKALSENSFDIIMRFDREYRHLYANSIVEKHTGIPASDFIGKTHREIGFSENLVNLCEQAIELVFKTGRMNRIEFTLPNGTWIDWLLFPEKNDTGQVTAVSTSARDITRIKEVEEELIKTKNYLRNIIDSMKFILVSTDPEGRIIQWNKTAETYAQNNELFRIEVWKIFPFLDKYKKYIKHVDEPGTDRSFVERINGESRQTLEIRFHPLNFDSSGGTVIFIDNITDQEKRESLLRQAQKMESIGNLSGGLAHDFNNVLGGVTGTASIISNELSKEKPDLNRIQKYMSTIQKASLRATELVSQLLSLSRKRDYSFQTINLTKTIKEVINICLNTFDRSVEFQTSFPEEDGDTLVKADPSGLEQVFLNLFINSMHALTIMRKEEKTYGGIIRVAVENFIPDEHFRMMFPDAVYEKYWKIEVMDTGVGMSPEVLSKIFDPFFSTKDQGEGTGLGLAMVYNIIEQHEGFIDTYSTEGFGTTFNIYLPEYTDPGNYKNSDQDLMKKVYRGKGLIMIVDDEQLMRETAGFLLEECGYNVISADGGEKALSLYLEKGHEIDAVILDLSMPRLSGLQTFEELKKINNEIKVLLSSGLSTDERIDTALRAGVKDFLKKPFDLEELSEKIYMILKE